MLTLGALGHTTSSSRDHPFLGTAKVASKGALHSKPSESPNGTLQASTSTTVLRLGLCGRRYATVRGTTFVLSLAYNVLDTRRLSLACDFILWHTRRSSIRVLGNGARRTLFHLPRNPKLIESLLSAFPIQRRKASGHGYIVLTTSTNETPTVCQAPHFGRISTISILKLRVEVNILYYQTVIQRIFSLQSWSWGSCLTHLRHFVVSCIPRFK